MASLFVDQDQDPEHPTFGIVIPAAGRGRRAGNSLKVYHEIGGETVISRVIKAFRAWDTASPIVIVHHADDMALLERAILKRDENTYCTVGRGTRQASVLQGLRFLTTLKAPPSHVLIHDAARPFISRHLLQNILNGLIKEPQIGLIPAIPVSDTLKFANSNHVITHTVSRQGLYRAQTPQAFPLSTILDVHEDVASTSEGATEYTDDASLFEHAGLPVRFIPGDEQNMKLTYPSDFDEADRVFGANTRPPAISSVPDIRVGHGYDTHRLVPGTEIVLCGIKIPHEFSLLGHSDADVGMHALTNALLGAIGADDIGSHFPPSDSKWKDVPSALFVQHARDIVAKAGGTITHCDITLVCETPRVSPHRGAMKNSVARLLGMNTERVAIKSGTNEKAGFVGRTEGIVAFATATVVFPFQPNQSI
ncbi:YgbB family-domain-containing protein [Aspergillus pseudoustus]|uniref:YgbB family-domain-containing protein n=1 Tax=Aspergillus pseudoustus TaxID=1810923 RepID=A0ABR4JJR2_9EURO